MTTGKAVKTAKAASAEVRGGGKLWCVINETATTGRLEGDPLRDLCFSDGFLEHGWPKVSTNAKQALRAVPAAMRGGVFIYHPHGQWRDDEGNWEKSMRAFSYLRHALEWGDIRGSYVQPDAWYRVQGIADVEAYTGAMWQINAPVMLYLGFEPPKLSGSEPRAVLKDFLHKLLRCEITVAAMRAAKRGSLANRRTFVCVDGLTQRPSAHWIMRLMAQWGLGPCIEGMMPASGVYEPFVFTPFYQVGEWRNYLDTGGVEHGRATHRFAHPVRSLVIYREDQGATPAQAVEALRAGIDVGMVINDSSGIRPEVVEVIRACKGVSGA